MILNKILPYILCISLFAVVSCRNKMADKVDMMISKKVAIDTMAMNVVKPMRSLYGSINNKEKYKLIVFYDDKECLSCKAGKLNEWHGLLSRIYYDYQNVVVYFIFSPAHNDVMKLKEVLASQRFGHVIYVDDRGIFRKQNPWLPNESLYHTFLVDYDNRIVLVGNPLQNAKISEMFFKRIQNLNKQKK